MHKLRLSLDSGAYSIFMMLIKKLGQTAFGTKLDYSWTKTQEFRDYLDHYGEFVQQHGHKFDFYVNLDIIYNPELSFEMWEYLRKNFHIKPIPVYHFGEDIKWLKKYMDETNYIGLSGVAGGLDKSKYRQHTDRVFKYLGDKKGTPRWKTHGFAMTAMELVQRYPWYTVDSSTWVKMSLCGIVLIPQMVDGKPNYKRGWQMITCSDRSKYTDKAAHYKNLSPHMQQHLLNYIEARGVALGHSEYELITKPKDYVLEGQDKWMGKPLADGTRWVEHRLELGIINDHQCRDMINLMLMIDLEDDLKPWPWSFEAKRPTLWDRAQHEDYTPSKEIVRTGTARTTVHLGGNFDLLVYKEKEKAMMEYVFGTGHDYSRMISFFFKEMVSEESDRTRNILELWQEQNLEQSGASVLSLKPQSPGPQTGGTKPRSGAVNASKPLRHKG